MSSTPLLSGEQLDPILLELGSSLYVCQGFEQTLVFLLAVVQMEEAAMADGSFDSAKQTLSRHNLGRLLDSLGRRVDLPADLENEFNAALKARNWIAHHFMPETALEMAYADGRKRALSKLSGLKRTVMRADKMALEVLDEYLSQFGPELRELEANASRVLQELYPQVVD